MRATDCHLELVADDRFVRADARAARSRDALLVGALELADGAIGLNANVRREDDKHLSLALRQRVGHMVAVCSKAWHSGEGDSAQPAQRKGLAVSSGEDVGELALFGVDLVRAHAGGEEGKR